MNNAMHLSFQVKSPKKKEYGKAPIYARITLNKVRTEFSLKRFIEPDKWINKAGNTKGNTEEIRSYNMSQIRSKNTKPELVVRKYLFANGFRYRLHSKDLPGKPDIVLPKYKTVIFVHGCFWHGHEGCSFMIPAIEP